MTWGVRIWGKEEDVTERGRKGKSEVRGWKGTTGMGKGAWEEGGKEHDS